MKTWLAALRIARRELRRAKGRSALVVALIGLPVLALTFAAVAYDSFRLTPEQEWERQFGRAEAQVSWWYEGPARQSPDGNFTDGAEIRQEPATEAELLAVLPAGGRLVPITQNWLEMRTAAGIGTLWFREADLADPIFDGMIGVTDGRAPARPGEAALTTQAATRLDATVGGTVATADGAQTYHVVGLVEAPGELSEQIVVYPGSLPTDGEGWFGDQSWLWTTPVPVSWTQVKELNQHGLIVTSRAVALDPPPDHEVDMPNWGDEGLSGQVVSGAVLIAGLGILEVVLLAGPAFAVGARRRQRELALVAAGGGTPAHLRRIVLADGVVLGLLAALIGIVLGILLALAARPLLEEQLWQARIGGYRFFPLALLGVAALAVLTGVLAALVPAFTASRQPVLQALTGRRGAVRSRKRWLLLGLVMAALGVAVTGYGAWQVSTNLVLAGLVLGELGLVFCTPTLVGMIARTGRFVPLSARIALRDTARNRASAAPAISAVMAAVAGGLVLGIFLDSDAARQRSEYLPALPEGGAAVRYESWADSTPDDPGPQLLAPEGQELVREAVADGLGGARLHDVATPRCAAGSEASECGLEVLTPPQNECPYWTRVSTLTEADQRAALADERCVQTPGYQSFQVASAYVDDGSDPALLGLLAGTDDEADLAAAAATLRSGGIVVTDHRQLVDGTATIVVHEYEASEPGDGTTREVTVPAYALTSATNPWLAVVPPAVVADAGLAAGVSALVAIPEEPPGQEERDALAATLRGIEPQLELYVEQGAPVFTDPRLLILAGAAGLVTLGAAGIATGLAAADRRGDLSTLAAVGASPRVRRQLALSQSGVIAGLGTLLGIAAGTGAALAVLFALNQRQAGRWPQSPLYPVDVPWQVLGLLLAVPVIAMLGAGLLTRSRLPIERRRF